MRRPLMIALVLMGGGALAAGILLPNREPNCEQARATPASAAAAANVDCSRSTTSRASHGSSSWRRTGSAVGAALGSLRSSTASAVRRGGFGGSGSRFSSSGGG